MAHHKDYTSKFFPELLKAENVVLVSDVNAIHDRSEKTEEAHKLLVAKISLSASATNQTNAAMQKNLSSLLSSRDKMQQQIKAP